MTDVKKLKNWTIMPIHLVTPEEACDGFCTHFPRLMGDVISHRRIGRTWEPCPDNHCGLSIPVDVMTSAIVAVHGMRHEHTNISVTTLSGNVYELVGKPRPSFITHCKAFGIDPEADSVVSQLFAKVAEGCETLKERISESLTDG